MTSDTPWNFALSASALAKDKIKESFIVEEKKQGKNSYPWNVDNAPIVIRTKAKILKDWKLVNGSVGPVAYYTQMDADVIGEKTIELIPFGCTTLRVAEFPVRR